MKIHNESDSVWGFPQLARFLQVGKFSSNGIASLDAKTVSYGVVKKKFGNHEARW
ncbi:MAG: hypothetical protein ABUK01_10715 [Leptospirales bacterium]